MFDIRKGLLENNLVPALMNRKQYLCVRDAAMDNLSIELCFLEPFRLIEWIDPKHRNPENPLWQRAQSWARWHGKNKGRPYVTGTLLRSAVIRAIEEELARSDGKWMGIPCCPGKFYTEDEKSRPKHLRHRSTISWGNQDIPVCQDRASACPLCLILGGLDGAQKKGGKKDSYDVRFGNLSPIGDPVYPGPHTIGRQRLLNRVDLPTGKAHDWFRVWEIDDPNIRRFNGIIEIAKDLPKRAEVLSLLKRALGFVDRLCGSMVTISVNETDDPIDAEINNGYPEAQEDRIEKDQGNDELTARIKFVMDQLPLNNSEFDAKRRIIADAIRALRTVTPPLMLPKGHRGPDSKEAGHFIWDKLKLHGGKQTLRTILSKAASAYVNDPAGWRRFCETLGQKIYDSIKRTPQSPKEKKKDIGFVTRPKPPVSYGDFSREGVTFSDEWIFVGKLRAETPFHVGVETESDDQTSLRVLLDKKNRFRLPRSVLRGVLRRDLGTVTGQGCMMLLGPERPCQCRVCRIMRQVAIFDSKSETTIAPDIRYRIRKNHFYGTVDEGALFDAECGLEGTVFPFVLRFRGGPVLPLELRKILSWWKEGKLFLGGGAATGKGRFKLDSLKCYRWNLQSHEDARAQYAENCGFRSEENDIDILFEDGQITSDAVPGLSRYTFENESHEYPWREVKWRISIDGPILSSDTIAALCIDESDAVFYRKTVIGEDGCPKRVVALKGESIRGLVRTALGRSAGVLIEGVHEDCGCFICRIFGNEHQISAIRFEDMVAEDTDEKLIHHISIDRFDGGVVEKYDDRPLIQSAGKRLSFTGYFWLKQDLESDDELKKALAYAFEDIRMGMYPIGGKSGIGYGWVTDISMTRAPEWLVRPLTANQDNTHQNNHWVLGGANTPYPPLPHMDAKASEIFNPYYFLSIDKDAAVHRDQNMISHESFHDGAITGKITCSLNVLSPLILPDAELFDEDDNGHRTFKFFNLNGEAAIPAGQIRAAISNVYEALTNSCFRVMKQKEYLSWRMDAGMYKDFQPGRILKGATQLKAMVSPPIRLPLYDDPESRQDTDYNEQLKKLLNRALASNISKNFLLDVDAEKIMNPWKLMAEDEQNAIIQHIENRFRPLTEQERRILFEQGLGGLDFTKLQELFNAEKEVDKIKKATRTNDRIANAARHNRQWLENLKNTNHDEYVDVIQGKKPVHFTTESLSGNDDPNFLIARLCDNNERRSRKGYLKITGPNNPNVSNLTDTMETPSFSSSYDAAWEDPLDFSFRLAGPPECLPNTKKNREFPRPGFTCIKDGKLYRITKRCERIFEEVKEGRTYSIPQKIRDQYRDILIAYRSNADHIPKAFRSRLPDENEPAGNELKENDLVYFKLNKENKVEAVIPVCISREPDIYRIGQRLPLQYRSCAHICLEDCPSCKAKSSSLPLYREGTTPRGLCPACHLFGVAGYKSRIRFGMAKPSKKDSISKTKITLPLQERPRPTWVLPKEIKKDKNYLKIPGRKFYLRHSGWKIIRNGKDPISGNLIEKGKNNITAEAVNEGTEFQFDIYFENLRPWELGILFYCLELEEGMAHMVGRGKNFGFGQISIKVSAINERIAPTTWRKWKPLTDQTAKDLDITKKGLDKLPELCDNKGVKWFELPHVAALRFLLTIHENIDARYPALDEKDPNRPPGYIQLKEKGYDANQKLVVQIADDEKASRSPVIEPWYSCSD